MPPPETDAKERPERASTLDVARDNIGTFGGWIAHANTKAALIAAGLTFILGATASQPTYIAGALAGASPDAAAARLALVVLGVAATASFIAVGCALFPRTKASPSRFGWPTVKDADVETLMRATADELERDAWTHAKKLADIADRKYLTLKVSLWLGVVTLLAFCAWVVLASRLPVP